MLYKGLKVIDNIKRSIQIALHSLEWNEFLKFYNDIAYGFYDIKDIMQMYIERVENDDRFSLNYKDICQELEHDIENKSLNSEAFLKCKELIQHENEFAHYPLYDNDIKPSIDLINCFDDEDLVDDFLIEYGTPIEKVVIHYNFGDNDFSTSAEHCGEYICQLLNYEFNKNPLNIKMFDKHFLYNLFQIGFYHGYYKISTEQFYSSTPMFENIKLKSNNTVDYLIGDLENFSKKLDITTQSNLIDKIIISPLDTFEKIEYITQRDYEWMQNNYESLLIYYDNVEGKWIYVIR